MTENSLSCVLKSDDTVPTVGLQKRGYISIPRTPANYAYAVLWQYNYGPR